MVVKIAGIKVDQYLKNHAVPAVISCFSVNAVLSGNHADGIRGFWILLCRKKKKKKRKQRLTALNTHLLLWKEVVLMDYFLAINNRQLGICLRMLFADGIQGHVETVLNEKDKIEFHIRIDTSEEIFEKLNERYEILIS